MRERRVERFARRRLVTEQAGGDWRHRGEDPPRLDERPALKASFEFFDWTRRMTAARRAAR